jgi:hypothetical protein
MITKAYPLELARVCRFHASRAGFPSLRRVLLNIADRCEMDARVIERSWQALTESRHLIATADKLLRNCARTFSEPRRVS